MNHFLLLINIQLLLNFINEKLILFFKKYYRSSYYGMSTHVYCTVALHINNEFMYVIYRAIDISRYKITLKLPNIFSLLFNRPVYYVIVSILLYCSSIYMLVLYLLVRNMDVKRDKQKNN